MSKTKIFVSAYACEPGLGSEIGVGWHWVLEMSKYYELWVLTRMTNKNSIETWIKEQKEKPNIHFVYYDLPKALRFWKKGLRGVRVYYNIWQKATNRIVKDVMTKNQISIYHLLTYGNSLWAASRFGMKKFFVWGPAGGADFITRDFTKFYGPRSRATECIRRMIVKTLPMNYGFHQRCKNANLILCKSYSMYHAVPNQYKEKAKLFTDCAVNEEILSSPQKTQGRLVHFVTVGRLDAWRNFDVLVEAFKKAYEANQNIRLDIVGTGKDLRRIKSLIKIRELTEVVNMTGQVSMEEYYRIMKKSDVVINPTYKEGAVTMSFDAMAMAKPLICIDTGGYTRYFTENCAIVLEKGTREQLIRDLTKAILETTDIERRYFMSEKAYDVAKKNTWKHKGSEISNEISKAYANYNYQISQREME